MDTTKRMGRGLRSALVDLERFARELADGQGDQDKHNVPHDVPRETTQRQAVGLEEDPIVPWIRVAIMGLVLIAAGILFQLVQQFA